MLARALLPLALLALFFGLIAEADAASPPSRSPGPAAVRVLSPRSRQLVTGRRLKVTLRTGAGVSHLRLEVAGHALRLGKASTRSGAHTATVATKGLPRGPVVLKVRARGHGRAIAFNRQVVIGRHAPGLLARVRLAHRAAGEARLHVRLGGRISDFRVTVDGRRARILEMPDQPAPSRPVIRLLGHGRPLKRGKSSPARPTTIRLSADDGLHPGRNRVVVLAYRQHDGRWARAVRTVWVSRRVPLVAAGQDRRIVAGTSLRLDGRNSRAVRREEELRYRWRIVSQPKSPRTSRPARLVDPHAVRPRLVTHRPGTYKVALQVVGTEPGPGRPVATASASRAHSSVGDDDVVTVEAGVAADPYGARIATDQEGELEMTCEECYFHKSRTTIEGLSQVRAVEDDQGDVFEADFEGVVPFTGRSPR
jgi:hypothetical protein